MGLFGGFSKLLIYTDHQCDNVTSTFAVLVELSCKDSQVSPDTCVQQTTSVSTWAMLTHSSITQQLKRMLSRGSTSWAPSCALKGSTNEETSYWNQKSWCRPTSRLNLRKPAPHTETQRGWHLSPVRKIGPLCFKLCRETPNLVFQRAQNHVDFWEPASQSKASNSTGTSPQRLWPPSPSQVVSPLIGHPKTEHWEYFECDISMQIRSLTQFLLELKLINNRKQGSRIAGGLPSRNAFSNLYSIQRFTYLLSIITSSIRNKMQFSKSCIIVNENILVCLVVTAFCLLKK